MKDGKPRSTSKATNGTKDSGRVAGKKRALTTDDLMRMTEDAQEGRARKRARLPVDEDEEEEESDDESEGQSEAGSSEEDMDESHETRTFDDPEESDGEAIPSRQLPSRIQVQDRFSSSLLTKQQRLTHQPKPTTAAQRSRQNESSSTSSRPPASFASYDIAPQLLTALRAMSIKAPTKVQAACIPPLLAGRDCIGNAKTGSGKTVAFALPILQRLSVDPYGLFALVLTPTRELAFQIADQFAVLGAPLNIRTAVIVGGMDMIAQAIELNNRPHVIVATPGRLVDHLRSKTGEWDLGRVKFLVLDEADRLLTATFADELGYLFEKVPKERQTCLFTATWTEAVERVANGPVRPGKEKPFVHRMTDSVETVSTLEQYYLLVPSHVREVYLYYLLCHPPDSILHLRRAPPEDPKKKKKKKTREEEEAPEQPPPTIIFCRKTKTAAYVTQLLQTLQIRSTALHSGLTQRERLNSLSLFRAHVVPVLVSTDVGARGLDIEDVGLVVNWDMPNEAEEYTHRVGRTGRAGKGGVAVSFVTEFDEERVLAVENRINTKLTEMSMKEELVLEELKKVSTAKRVVMTS